MLPVSHSQGKRIPVSILSTRRGAGGARQRDRPPSHQDPPSRKHRLCGTGQRCFSPSGHPSVSCWLQEGSGSHLQGVGSCHSRSLATSTCPTEPQCSLKQGDTAPTHWGGIRSRVPSRTSLCARCRSQACFWAAGEKLEQALHPSPAQNDETGFLQSAI